MHRAEEVDYVLVASEPQIAIGQQQYRLYICCIGAAHLLQFLYGLIKICRFVIRKRQVQANCRVGLLVQRAFVFDNRVRVVARAHQRRGQIRANLRDIRVHIEKHLVIPNGFRELALLLQRDRFFQ